MDINLQKQLLLSIAIIVSENSFIYCSGCMREDAGNDALFWFAGGKAVKSKTKKGICCRYNVTL
jgi:hypothetical protein